MKYLLEGCIDIAVRAHTGQVDATGVPYIAHPLRVMLAALKAGYDLHQQCAAVLHDVPEDCPDVGLDDLLSFGIPQDVVTMVEYLTRDPGYRGQSEEPYPEFVTRVARHPRAARIKLLDIEDNMSRLRGISDMDKRLRLFRKYSAATDALEQALAPHGGRWP